MTIRTSLTFTFTEGEPVHIWVAADSPDAADKFWENFVARLKDPNNTTWTLSTCNTYIRGTIETLRCVHREDYNA